MIGDFTLKLG